MQSDASPAVLVRKVLRVLYSSTATGSIKSRIHMSRLYAAELATCT